MANHARGWSRKSLVMVLWLWTAVSSAEPPTATPTPAIDVHAIPTPALTRTAEALPARKPTAAVRPPKIPTPESGPNGSLPLPDRESSVQDPRSADPRLHEYEIRLAAHRRELLEREAELDAAKRQLAKLKTTAPVVGPDFVDQDRIRELARSESAARAEATRLRDEAEDPRARLQSVTTERPPPVEKPPQDGDKALIASFQRELDVERENRATLEQEIQRLVDESRAGERGQALSQSLENARAEILFLNHRLAAEQRARETLEVTIDRVRRAGELSPGNDWLDRFEATMRERREQAERLQEELHKANEAVVDLRGRLESVGTTPANDGARIEGLEGEIKKLRDALHSAEQANADLRSQAELAARLAELLYGQSR